MKLASAAILAAVFATAGHADLTLGGFMPGFWFGCASQLVEGKAWDFEPESDQEGRFSYKLDRTTVEGLFPVFCTTRLSAATVDGEPKLEGTFTHTSKEIRIAEEFLVKVKDTRRLKPTLPCMGAYSIPRVEVIRSWAYADENGGTVEMHIYRGRTKASEGEELALHVGVFAAHDRTICGQGHL